MIGQLCETIVRFFIQRKAFFWLLFAGIVAVLVMGISRLKINEDLYAIFPKGKEFQQFNRVVQQNKLNKQLVFSIPSSGDDEVDYEHLLELKTALEKRFHHDLDEVQIERIINEAELLNFYQRSALINLQESDYQRIASKLVPDSIDAGLAKSANMLQGPKAVFLSNLVAQDPLGLFYQQLNAFNPLAKKGKYIVKNGVVYSADESTVFFFSSLRLANQDTKEISAFASKIERFKQEKTQQKLGFDYFGTFQIAVDNATQIKADTTLTSILSIVAILLLLIVYFRSLIAPLYFILPGLFSILCGGGIIGFVHPNISAISLATSSVLLGIVLDYTFHFVTHLKHAGSVFQTVKEVAAPMLTGSFTTLVALGALMFTQSTILQDFGLIALCTLSGAVLFTLFFLPVFLVNARFKSIDRAEKTTKKRKNLTRIGLACVALITAYFMVSNVSPAFNADINSLSHHSKELKEKEQFYTGIDPSTQKKVFVFASNKKLELAKEINDEVYQRFVNHQDEFGISELVSLSPYQPASSTVERADERWINFWKKHPNTQADIERFAANHGLNAAGFEPFYKWIHQPAFQANEGKTYTAQLGLDKFYATSNQQHHFLTVFTVEKAKQDELKQELTSIPGIYVLDISSLTSSMLTIVKNDFNYLFLFTSLLVFLSLLVIYGRIELAMFAFFPMVLAWIWISGISATFDLSFNFVNILVATFIFGLGDDYSIFTTDGLIQQFKTGVNSLKSYRSGIVLSGITTLIGTGALYFAKHPSIHSIGLISVVGIGTILLITLYVQPALFNFFVSKRIQKKRGPITFLYFIYSLLLFSYFFLGSMLINVVLLCFILPLPIRKLHKQNMLNYLVSKLAKSTLYAGIHVKKGVVDGHKLDYSKPAIIIANHSSFLDILAVLMLHPKTVIFVKKWVYQSPVFGFFIRFGGYLFAEDGSDENSHLVEERLAAGYSVVIFPEGKRSADGQIHRFHKGAFYLSKALNVPIQPVLILGTHEVNPRNDFMINEGQIWLKALDRISCGDDESYKAYCLRATNLMRSAMLDFRHDYAGTAFYRRKVMENFLFKGPILEWYVRVKWMLEHKNFDVYNQLIGSRKSIVDIGCGYGYLSLFLHYHNSNRIVLGLDYDEEKIAVASNAIAYSENLTFAAVDIRQFDFSPTDVFFFNDVLHYLNPEEQQAVLQRAVDTLLPGGILFIRDGIEELSIKHKNTKRTEELSTKFFKFNKTTNELHFLSAVSIEHFANTNGLGFELVEHSTKTSNVLMILRKP